MNTYITSVKRFIGIIVFIACITLSSQTFAQSGQYFPAMVNLVLDRSKSMEERDFRIMLQVVAEFAEVLHTRAALHPGEWADQLTVNLFGGYLRSNDYQELPFINCSQVAQIALLEDELTTMVPKYGYTAIYNAIVRGTNQMIDQDQKLPGDYLKMLIVVTDGKDNDSAEAAKRSVREFYPNDTILLVVVGVGNEAHVDEFKNDADLVIHLNQFDELLATLTLLLEMTSQSEIPTTLINN